MKNIFSRLQQIFAHIFASGRMPQRGAVLSGEGTHIVVPDAVTLPLPRSPREELSVPASINGRDLSTGRL